MSGESPGNVISGTRGWTRFEREVNIPKKTKSIMFGIMSQGKGTVWVDRFRIDVLPAKP